ncbi:hypothetical protein L209DRAFT_241597 [Thermothelomyces heterothallicus CBS 203.75]
MNPSRIFIEEYRTSGGSDLRPAPQLPQPHVDTWLILLFYLPTWPTVDARQAPPVNPPFLHPVTFQREIHLFTIPTNAGFQPRPPRRERFEHPTTPETPVMRAFISSRPNLTAPSKKKNTQVCHFERRGREKQQRGNEAPSSSQCCSAQRSMLRYEDRPSLERREKKNRRKGNLRTNKVMYKKRVGEEGETER